MTHHSNTPDRLRSLYDPVGGVRGVFSSKVADYCAARPDYPEGLYETLRVHCHLNERSLIADVGAGTGLLTQGFLRQRYGVVAVEPNAAMREACDHRLGRFEGYRSAAGCAECIPLDSTSVDLVTAAQAFHWFEIPRAKTECLRVLKENGQVALIWNDRVLSDPLHLALDEVFARFGGERRAELVVHEKARGDVAAFFGNARPFEFTWPHIHFLNSDELLSLAFSRSYMPPRDSAEGVKASDCIQKIFTTLAMEERVGVRYTTVAIVGRPE